MASGDQHDGVKISIFPTASDINSEDLVTGLKNRVNTNFTFGTILNWFRRSVSNLYIALSEKGAPNGVASLDLNGHIYGTQLPFSQVNPLIDGSASPGTSAAVARNDHRHPTDVTRLAASEKGAANGVASLGSDGKVPSAQLPTIPSASSATPQNLGTAAAGSSTDYSRADHVHNKPTYSASDVGLGNVDNVQQYSANNPPPYPVTSVNGSTGAVTVQATITANGILKGDGQGGVSAATAGTDYSTPAQLASLVLKPASAFALPASGSSVSKDMSGLTADHELIRWNFYDNGAIVSENQPPADLTWTTYAGYFTITNNGGTTTATIQPVFAIPSATAISNH